jgi:hypothetical protein
MHEEPIVCAPADAVRAFLQGHLDGPAIGPYFVPHPERKERGATATGRAHASPVTARRAP